MPIQRDKEADLKKLADRVIQELFFDARCENGTPTLDCKRPFGSSMNLEGDILEIIGWAPIDPETDRSGANEQKRYAGDLYKEDVVPYIQKRWKELPERAPPQP